MSQVDRLNEEIGALRQLVATMRDEIRVLHAMNDDAEVEVNSQAGTISRLRQEVVRMKVALGQETEIHHRLLLALKDHKRRDHEQREAMLETNRRLRANIRRRTDSAYAKGLREASVVPVQPRGDVTSFVADGSTTAAKVGWKARTLADELAGGPLPGSYQHAYEQR